jgi:hypothetical protein
MRELFLSIVYAKLFTVVGSEIRRFGRYIYECKVGSLSVILEQC